MSHDPARGNASYPAAATLGMSVCGVCGVCSADHIGWLRGGDLDLSSLSVCILPSAPWHMGYAVCRRTAHSTVWIQSLVSLGGCRLWWEIVARDGGCPSFTPRPRLASAVLAFQRRKIDTEPSERAARQKEGEKVTSLHGVA